MSTAPVLAPIQKLLQSRKFILVLAYILVQLLVRAIPSLTPYTYDLTIIVTFALGALFLHLSIEDIIKLLKSDSPTSLADAEQTALVTGGSILIGGATSVANTTTTPNAVG